MATDSGKKLFVGPRFRRIRQQLGLSQTQIAEGLGISPSYVNLIERNQRPVTAQILLRLAETYDLDLRDLATADEDRFFAELNEVFSDPLFRQIELPKQELRDLAELCPGVTHALQRLYAAYTEARRGETMVAAQFADRDETTGTRYEANPIERIRDLIEANRNYFPELETAAETLRDEIEVAATHDLFAALSERILPAIVQDRRPGDRVRIWSLPCSTGDECYSIAIWLLENWALVNAYLIEIVGSDIDTRALAAAREGRYGTRALSQLPESVREAYFESEHRHERQIIQDLRESVGFTQANIVDRQSMRAAGRFDVILCRNLLIYFDEEGRRTAAENLYDALNPGGFLCLGHSESMARIDPRFTLVRLGDAIVYRRD